MSTSDRQFFPVGVEQLDFPAFSHDYGIGLRRYICREDLATLPAAKRKFLRLRVAHVLVLIVYYALIVGFWWALFQRIGVWSAVVRRF